MTISPSAYNSILRMATLFEQGRSHDAREIGRDLLGRGELKRRPITQKTVEEVMEAGRVAPGLVNGSSDSSDERPMKRLTVAPFDVQSMPPAVQREWQILRPCYRTENETLFLRAQARALRVSILAQEGAMRFSLDVRSVIFSFLKSHDLCVLSACRVELNYQIQHEGKLWKLLGEKFSFPADYWQGNDFSKKRCVQNLRYMHAANLALEKMIAGGLIREASGPERVGLVDLATLDDPQERFVRRTLAIMKNVIDAVHPERDREVLPHVRTSSQQFRNLVGFIKIRPSDFVNLFWTCGYPRHAGILGEVAQLSMRYVRSDADALDTWLSSCEWIAKHTLQWSERMDDNFPNLLFGFARPVHVLVWQFRAHSPENQARIGRLLAGILKKGCSVNSYDLKRFGCEAGPLGVFNSLLGAVEDRLRIPQAIFSFLHGCFRPKGLLAFHPVEEVVSALNLFKVNNSWGDVDRGGFEEHQPRWIYQAAMTQSSELMRIMTELGVKSSYKGVKSGFKTVNSLTMALEENAPIAVIELMRKWNVRPTEETFQLVFEHTSSWTAQSRLEDLLGEPE